MCLLLNVKGASMKIYKKATEAEVEEAVAEVLRYAPHRPGGSKFKVCEKHNLKKFVLVVMWDVWFLDVDL